jgi:uncharacterized protein YpmB
MIKIYDRKWKCRFCGKNFDTVKGLSIHLGKKQRKIIADKSMRGIDRAKKALKIQEEKKRLKKFYSSQD